MLQPTWALFSFPESRRAASRDHRRPAPVPWRHGMTRWPTMDLPGRR